MGLAQGFADPVTDSQSIFHAAMMALSRPGTIERVTVALHPPDPLTPELAALALALVDHETPLWLDARLAASTETRDYLRFHTGAPLTDDPSVAAFALIVDPLTCPPLSRFAQGTDENPDRSTTLAIGVERLDEAGFRLTGPGVATETGFRPAPLPADFAAQWMENRKGFPRGVDCLFVAPGQIAGLPRSTLLMEP